MILAGETLFGEAIELLGCRSICSWSRMHELEVQGSHFGMVGNNKFECFRPIQPFSSYDRIYGRAEVLKMLRHVT